MNSTTSIFLATVAAFSVAGCTSGNGTGGLISASEQALRVFADTDRDGVADQDIATVLNRDEELVAREVSEASFTEVFGGVGVGSHSLTDGDVRIRGDGNDLLVTMSNSSGLNTTVRIVDARSITTNPVDIDNRATGGFRFLFFVGGGSVSDLFNSSTGDVYSEDIYVFYEPAGGTNTGNLIYGIVGTETQDSMIRTLRASNATATYNGFAFMAIRQAGAGWDIYNAELSGDLAMTADFGASTVSGSITNLAYEERAGNSVTQTLAPAGSIAMNPTSIQDNAFSGTMSPDAALTSSSPEIATFSGQVGYSGAFYGPQAEEISGTLQGGATINGVDYIGIGTFDGQ